MPLILTAFDPHACVCDAVLVCCAVLCCVCGGIIIIQVFPLIFYWKLFHFRVSSEVKILHWFRFGETAKAKMVWLLFAAHACLIWFRSLNWFFVSLSLFVFFFHFLSVFYLKSFYIYHIRICERCAALCCSVCVFVLVCIQLPECVHTYLFMNGYETDCLFNLFHFGYLSVRTRAAAEGSHPHTHTHIDIHQQTLHAYCINNVLNKTGNSCL